MNALQQAQFAPNSGGFQQAQIPQFTNQGMAGQNPNFMSIWSSPQASNGFSFQGPNSMSISTNNLSSIPSQMPQIGNQISNGVYNGFPFQGPNSMAISTNNLSSIPLMSSPIEIAVFLFNQMVDGLSRILEQVLPGGLASLLGLGGAGGTPMGAPGMGAAPGIGSQMPISQTPQQPDSSELPPGATPPTVESKTGFRDLLRTGGEFLRNDEAVDAALTAAGKIPYIGTFLDNRVTRWGAELLGQAIGWFD